MSNRVASILAVIVLVAVGVALLSRALFHGDPPPVGPPVADVPAPVARSLPRGDEPTPPRPRPTLVATPGPGDTPVMMDVLEPFDPPKELVFPPTPNPPLDAPPPTPGRTPAGRQVVPVQTGADGMPKGPVPNPDDVIGPDGKPAPVLPGGP